MQKLHNANSSCFIKPTSVYFSKYIALKKLAHTCRFRYVQPCMCIYTYFYIFMLVLKKFHQTQNLQKGDFPY